MAVQFAGDVTVDVPTSTSTATVTMQVGTDDVMLPYAYQKASDTVVFGPYEVQPVDMDDNGVDLQRGSNPFISGEVEDKRSFQIVADGIAIRDGNGDEVFPYLQLPNAGVFAQHKVDGSLDAAACTRVEHGSGAWSSRRGGKCPGIPRGRQRGGRRDRYDPQRRYPGGGMLCVSRRSGPGARARVQERRGQPPGRRAAVRAERAVIGGDLHGGAVHGARGRRAEGQCGLPPGVRRLHRRAVSLEAGGDHGGHGGRGAGLDDRRPSQPSGSGGPPLDQ